MKLTVMFMSHSIPSMQNEAALALEKALAG
jgi:hypothetical protein